MSNRIYTDAQLADIIAWRTEGIEWSKVATRFLKKYKVSKSANALRCAFKENKHLFDLSDEVTTLAKLKEIARVKNLNTKKNKDNRIILNHLNEVDDLVYGIEQAIKTIKKDRRKGYRKSSRKTKGRELTIELLFSDWQIGKRMDDYNSEIALLRLKEYTRAALFKIKQYQQLGYNIKRIVLPLLGDIIESSEKHKNSARGTDCSTPDQIQKAIEGLYLELIVPLAHLGIPMEVIGIPGNHDWNDHGINMFYPGVEHYSWVIYNTLKLCSEREGLKHVTYNIAVGAFTTIEIYGHSIVYEHGVGVKVDNKSMQTRLDARARQLGKHVTYYRMGDKHNISRFNEDTLVCNGAFFGGDKRGVEFSGISGYNAMAGQIMFAYTPRDDERLPIYDSFTIQLQHIK